MQRERVSGWVRGECARGLKRGGRKPRPYLGGERLAVESLGGRGCGRVLAEPSCECLREADGVRRVVGQHSGHPQVANRRRAHAAVDVNMRASYVPVHDLRLGCVQVV